MPGFFQLFQNCPLCDLRKGGTIMTPTQRSLKKLRDEGFECDVVEKWIPFARIRKDLFGFADILAYNQYRTIFVQTTTASNASARVKKIRSLPVHAIWLGSNREIHVHSWAKRGGRGKRKTWDCVVVPILSDRQAETTS